MTIPTLSHRASSNPNSGIDGFLAHRLSLLTLCAFLFAATDLQAGLKITTLFSFNWTNGAVPTGEMVQGADGSLYGVTAEGGSAAGYGSIFKISLDGVFTSLVSLADSTGYSPNGLVLATNGNFYGTAYYGGLFNKGTVFKVTPEGSITLLACFDGTNGCNPASELIEAADGNLYGTTPVGGIPGDPFGGYGTIFRLTPDGSLITAFLFNADTGFNTWPALTKGQDGNLYGTTGNGGAYTNVFWFGYGTAFRLSLTGGFSKIASFDGTNGMGPKYALVAGKDGNFYGTSWGGTNLDSDRGPLGNFFRVTPSGEIKSIFSFNGTNGSLPRGLMLARDGNFYGVTGSGGAGFTGARPFSPGGGEGTIFQITTSGVLTSLHSFTNRVLPLGGLVQASDGNLYGTTRQGGAYGWGTIFRLSVPMPPVLQPVSSTGSTLAITWTSVSGQTYQVQCSSNIFSASWQPLGSPVIATNGTMTILDSIGSAQQKFYRVVMLP
jgi:uncharacterized repeat protein (TIGR03803 family)